LKARVRGIDLAKSAISAIAQRQARSSFAI
jgi:hypothetical protein